MRLGHLIQSAIAINTEVTNIVESRHHSKHSQLSEHIYACVQMESLCSRKHEDLLCECLKCRGIGME